MQLRGKQLSGSHHAHASDMSTLRLYDEPVVSVIRNPYDVIISQWAYHVRNTMRFTLNPDFKFFFDWYKPDGYTGFGDKIAQYQDYVDHYYAFERGIESFFNAVGITDVEIPWIGKEPHPEDRITVDELDPHHKQLIDDRFGQDIELYQSVVSRDCHFLA